MEPPRLLTPPPPRRRPLLLSFEKLGAARQLGKEFRALPHPGALATRPPIRSPRPSSSHSFTHPPTQSPDGSPGPGPRRLLAADPGLPSCGKSRRPRVPRSRRLRTRSGPRLGAFSNPSCRGSGSGSIWAKLGEAESSAERLQSRRPAERPGLSPSRWAPTCRT